MSIYFDSKPVTIDTEFDPTSTNAVSGVAVKEAVDEAVEGMFKPAGSITFAQLPTLSADVLGFVYDVTDDFTTDSRFVEGAGISCVGGTNVAVVNTGTSSSPVYKFDTLAAAKDSVEIDNITVTKNASDELQASAVMNARTGTDVLPIWQGTQQQWTEGVGTDWYNWRTDVSISASQTSTFPTYTNNNINDTKIVSGNGKFVLISSNQNNNILYSNDGETWFQAGTIPVTATWGKYGGLCFGNGKFVAVGWDSSNSKTVFIHSTDGDTWTLSNTSFSGYSEGTIAYGNNTFVMLANGGSRTFTSSDGETWTENSVSSNGYYGLAFGNGKFVTSLKSQLKMMVSNDGINWSVGATLSTQNAFERVYFAGDYFFACPIYADTKILYSQDGQTWNTATLPESSYFGNILYFNGVYTITNDYLNLFYSSDLITWTNNSQILSAPYRFTGNSGIVNNNKIIYPLKYGTSSSNAKIYVTFEQGSVYTLSTTPEATDTVYSEPNTASALTITSVGTGTITLSDNNTYTYTQSGDEVTYQSIGEAHPTWLCNINGVGVKVGTTVVADNTDTSTLQTKANLVTSVDSSSTNSQYPSAKLFYDTVGDIETLLQGLR